MKKKPEHISQADWDAVDVPELTAKDFERSLPFEKLPSVIQSAIRGKQRITIRLDADIIERFKLMVEQSGGGSYQAEINKALREYISGKGVVEAVREVVREELKHAA